MYYALIVVHLSWLGLQHQTEQNGCSTLHQQHGRGHIYSRIDAVLVIIIKGLVSMLFVDDCTATTDTSHADEHAGKAQPPQQVHSFRVAVVCDCPVVKKLVYAKVLSELLGQESPQLANDDDPARSCMAVMEFDQCY